MAVITFHKNKEDHSAFPTKKNATRFNRSQVGSSSISAPSNNAKNVHK